MKIGKILRDDPTGYYMLSITKTRKVADLLEQSEEFEKGILFLREKYKIPKKGYPFKEGYYTESLFDDETIEALYDDSDIITKKLKLPLYWSGTISFFAIHNLFLTPEKISMEIHYLGGFMTPNDFIFHKTLENGAKDKSIFIEITEKLSKEQLHQLIDQEWKEIQDGMELNLFETPQHRMARASLAKRIVEMRDKTPESKSKIKFGEIADILQKENQGNDLYDVLSEDYVKILYYRWKKVIGLKK